MKITDIIAHVMEIPDPDGRTPRRNWIFVEIRTDEGLTGIGEATTEYCELAVKAQIETELRPRLLGMNPLEIGRIWTLGFRHFWWRMGVVHTSAMSGIDQALWDLKGKATGLPVYELLGGRVRDRVRLYARIRDVFAEGEATLEEDILQAVEEEGFDAFKSGFGPLTQPFDEMEQVRRAVDDYRRMRDAAGPDVALMCDAAGVYSPTAAARLIQGLREVDIFFVEEPTNQDTVNPTLQLKRAYPDVKIAVGERLFTRWGFREWFESQAIDVCQADICHTGGISELMKIAHYAEVYGIQIAPHNPYGPVALAAAAHAAAAMPNFVLLEHCRLRPWFEDVQKVAVPIVRGYVDLDELGKRPGLGVELDMEMIKNRPHRPLGANPFVLKDGSSPLV
jgi:galactonate dehydratase